jgi:hypothetical protein
MFIKIPSTEELADMFTTPLGCQSFHSLIKDGLFWVSMTLVIAAGNELKVIF